MEYYAELLPTSTPTTKVPIILNVVDDWWAWNKHITGLARSYGVLDILLGKQPYLTQLIQLIHPGVTLANQRALQGKKASRNSQQDNAAANQIA